MKTLSCKDMGMDDGYVARGETEEEVMEKMMEHGKKAHADKMKGMSDEDMMKMAEDMKMKIKDE